MNLENTRFKETNTTARLEVPLHSSETQDILQNSRGNDSAEKYLPKLEFEDKQSKQSLEKQYGVTVTEKDGKYEYHLKANGKDQILFGADKTEAGLRDANSQLAKLVAEKSRDIEQRHNVTISSTGERPVSMNLPNGEKQSIPIPLRNPRLDELEGLDAALKRSNPSSKIAGGSKKLDITFLDVNFGGGPATYDADTQSVFINKPTASIPATQADATNKYPSTDGTRSTPSLEYVLTHELAHNGEVNNGVVDPSKSMYEQNNPDMAKRLGYVARKESQTDPSLPQGEHTTWDILGKDGSQYSQNDEGLWIRRNKEGKFIDSAGKEVSSERDAEHLTYDQLRERAAVKPVTDYIADPKEAYAETMTRYRIDQHSRKSIMRESPELYSAIKNYDQLEINKVHGTNTDGSPKFIRSPSGILVDNNEENRTKVAVFEKD